MLRRDGLTKSVSRFAVLLWQGHKTWNSVLRCFHYEVMHEGDDVVCHEGRLSMELLRRHDPEFARAAREGVVWKILSRHVAAQLPQLLGLVQRMGNATLHRGEHELQLMRRLHQTWVQMSSQGVVDFLALKNKVTTGKSVHGKSMPGLASVIARAWTTLHDKLVLGFSASFHDASAWQTCHPDIATLPGYTTRSSGSKKNLEEV